MTDKLYFGAMTARRLNHQPNTIMPHQILKKLVLPVAFGLLWCFAGTTSVAQIATGTNGSVQDAFASIPAASSWSTKSAAGGAADAESDAAMDSLVNGPAHAASTINAQVNNVAGDPPGTLATAQWTSSGYLVTRPTGNAVTFLMATLTNVTGGLITSLHIRYDYAQKLANAAVANELVKGHRVYYNLSGAAGQWVSLGNYGNSFTTNLVQAIDIEISLNATPWTNSRVLYLLFADDNSNPNADGANSIDNFRATDVAAILAPVITSHPQSTSVAPNGSVTFAVGASGANPLSYFWRKNGAFISNATNRTHTINNAVVGDAGNYSVIVSNSFGSVTSAVAVLTVVCDTAASINSQPVGQSLNSGGTISLTVGAVGTSPFTYQWYRNNAAILNATNQTFSKPNAQGPDSGLYHVVVNNCIGTPAVSTNVVVSVADATYSLLGLTNHFWRYENSNTDLGTAWRETNYNDSAWPLGRGIFAFENLAAINPLINTVLALTNLTSGGQDIPADYFRTTFVLTNDPALVNLVVSNYFDDGAVVYLNGQEAFRYNMAAGAVTFNTLAQAANPAGEGVFIVSNLPPSLLVQGTNYLAVQVHQNSLASSDIAFGMAVLVVFKPPTPLAITNQPQSITVFETKPAVLTLGLQGEPAYYQWYKDGVPVPNGTANPLVIAVATTNDAGNYFVIATNYINSVTSAVVTLTVLPDTNSPVLVEADGTANLTNVLVSFSELIQMTNATNVLNYQITNTVSGALLTISRAVLQNGTNVLLTTSARTPGQNYILVVNNLRDVSPRANLIHPNSSIPVRSLLTVMALNGTWRYYDPFPPFDEPDLGTAWKEFTYNEGANIWADGFGIFYNGQDNSDVPGPIGTGLSQTDTITTYFRGPFNLQASPGGLRLLMTHVIDDGGIVYLNGTEVLRFNMPAGTVNYQTPATAVVDPGTRVGPIALPNNSFRLGANMLAVELHQNVTIDVDKIFGLQLDAAVQSFVVGPVAITAGPQDITVVEGQSATFTVVQAGGLTFQWQTNSVNVAGATNDSYTVPLVTLAMNGRLFRVGVSNPTSGLVFTTNATLRVVTDTNRPTVISAFAQTNNTIVVSFSETMAAATAQNTANYRVTNSSGGVVAVSGAALSNGTNVILSFATQLAGRYTVVMSNLTDIASVPNAILPGTAVTVGTDYLIAMTSGWKYLIVNTNATIQSTFMQVGFNDSAWPGPSNALFYVEDAALPAPKNTPLTLLDGGGNRINTYYFRQRFVAPATDTNVTLRIRHIIDDGMVLYLNGVEIYRFNMPAGTPGAGTQAAPNVGNAVLVTAPNTVTLTNLVGGTNVLAVEVHQEGTASSDVVMGVELALSSPSVVIPPPTNQPPVCTYVAPSVPLRIERVGTNLVLSWTNVATNNCPPNNTTLFTLQRTFAFSNSPLSTVWVPVTTVSPYVTPATNSTVFFRLRQ
jgi:hypothetical protein